MQPSIDKILWCIEGETVREFAQDATNQLQALLDDNIKWRKIAKMFASPHIEINHAMQHGNDDFYGLVLNTKYDFDAALEAFDQAEYEQIKRTRHD